MRKTRIDRKKTELSSCSQEEWFDLEAIAVVEVTSEGPDFPIESAFAWQSGRGWRATENGEQTIRIVFDKPTPLRRIRLEFSETGIERTQEFTLKWSSPDGPLREIVRQQWTFSPQGSTSEIEDYRVELNNASVLELNLKPDLQPGRALASLDSWRVA
jgi:hypothetical protein